MTKKWNKRDYIKLKVLYKLGWKYKKIAKELDTTHETVRAYICNKRESWNLKIRRKDDNRMRKL